MKNDKIDILTTLTAYHEKVAEINLFFSELKRLYSASYHEKVQALYEEYYIANIINHFLFEEEVVFPALISSKKGKLFGALVVELTAEHGHLRALADNLLRHIQERKDQIDNAIGPFQKMLLDHARTENVKILPFIESNVQVRFLMGRRFLQVRARLKNKSMTPDRIPRTEVRPADPMPPLSETTPDPSSVFASNPEKSEGGIS